jgi:hypothetical protein
LCNETPMHAFGPRDTALRQYAGRRHQGWVVQVTAEGLLRTEKSAQ